jgi:hypothetical protein
MVPPFASMQPLAQLDEEGPQQQAGAAAADSAGGGEDMRLELAVLLETLVELQQQFCSPAADEEAEELLVVQLHVLLPLLQLLLGSYHATLHPRDRAILRVLLLLDGAAADLLGSGGASGVLAARLSGPLAAVGFLWGEAGQQAMQELAGSCQETGEAGAMASLAVQGTCHPGYISAMTLPALRLLHA